MLVFLLSTRVKKNICFMNNKSKSNLIPAVSDVTFGYVAPSAEDNGGWDLNGLPNELDPNFVTGFTDAEGCFRISILKNKEIRTQWWVQAVFRITLHRKDKAILDLIQSTLGVGKVYTTGPDAFSLEVCTVKGLRVIIAHFDKYPLISQKWADFELFKLAVNIMLNEEHLTMEGIKKLVSIKASMNRGLPDKLKEAFPGIIPVVRPLVPNQTIPDPYWVAGFMSGEGSVYVRVRKSSTHQIGFQVELILQMTQHTRDEQLLLSFIDYFGCGRYRLRKGGMSGDFIVGRLSDLTVKMIPFFETYPILGVKAKDFEDFKQVVKLMNSATHLTLEGLEQIRQIQAGMNRGRTMP